MNFGAEADKIIGASSTQQPLTRLYGTVTSDSPFEVTVPTPDGAGQVLTDLKHFSAYTPNEGDVVYILRCGRELVVCDTTE